MQPSTTENPTGKDAAILTKNYPLDIDCYAPDGEDRHLCSRMLAEESLNLFQISGGGATLLWSTRDGAGKMQLQRQFLESEDIEAHGVQQFLEGDGWEHLVFVVQPAFSWSHFSITESAFRGILGGMSAFTLFLRVVHTFGKKINDQQRSRDLAYYRIEPPSAYEFCYNIRYFERNGRGRGNPWSLRQTGVYHGCRHDSQSTWIILNYSDYVFSRIAMALEQGTRLKHQGSSFRPHLFIFSAAIGNWGQYIEHLRQKVKVYEEKAFSSRIDRVYLDNYKLLFDDVQEMVSLDDVLNEARAVIDGQRDAISRCKSLYTKLRDGGGKRRHRVTADLATTLDTLKADLDHYHKSLVRLAWTASRIMNLLSAILGTRANDSLRATTAAIQTSVADLQIHSGRAGQDTANLLQIAGQGHKDARVVKTLAQIATVFLPASLVASLFSSAILSNSDGNIPYVGLYLAITLPLLLVTLSAVVLLDKGLPGSLSRSRLF